MLLEVYHVTLARYLFKSTRARHLRQRINYKKRLLCLLVSFSHALFIPGSRYRCPKGSFRSYRRPSWRASWSSSWIPFHWPLGSNRLPKSGRPNQLGSNQLQRRRARSSVVGSARPPSGRTRRCTWRRSPSTPSRSLLHYLLCLYSSL